MSLRQNVRNFLLIATIEEIRKELEISIEAGETERAGYVAECLEEALADSDNYVNVRPIGSAFPPGSCRQLTGPVAATPTEAPQGAFFRWPARGSPGRPRSSAAGPREPRSPHRLVAGFPDRDDNRKNKK